MGEGVGGPRTATSTLPQLLNYRAVVVHNNSPSRASCDDREVNAECNIGSEDPAGRGGGGGVHYAGCNYVECLRYYSHAGSCGVCHVLSEFVWSKRLKLGPGLTHMLRVCGWCTLYVYALVHR